MFNFSSVLAHKFEATTHEEALAFAVIRVVRWIAVLAAIALMVLLAALYFTTKYTLILAKWAYDMGDEQPVSSYVAPCVALAITTAPTTIKQWYVKAVEAAKHTTTTVKALYSQYMGLTVQTLHNLQSSYANA